MVGVPGRSKGCSTCRKRKKGCDKTRPVCTNCSNAGLQCGGYERERVFLNHTQGTKSKAVHVVYRKGYQHTSFGGATDIAPDIAPDIALAHSLAQTASIEGYVSIFLTKYFPGGRTMIPGRLGSSRNWIEIAHGLYTSDEATRFALLSLGLFAVGESQHATQSYCFALHKLQRALDNPRQARNDSTLAACQLLSLLEVSLLAHAANPGHFSVIASQLPALTIMAHRQIFHGAEENVLSQECKWRSHVSGLLALIRTRSPQAYQSGVSHQLFANGRYALLIASITHRQRFPLNSPEWKTIPWEKQSKSSMDKLYDIMADLCEILADTDEMRYCDDAAKKSNLRDDVKRDCYCLDSGLQNWLMEAGPLVDFYNNDGIPVCPADSADLLLAHMTLLYWTLRIVLYATLISIHDPPLSEVPADISPLPYIRSVANALPYFWSPGAGMYGANLAASPWGLCLHMIYAMSDRYQDEAALLERFAAQQSGANTVLRFLNSLQRSSAGPEMASLDGKEGMILRAQKWMMGNH
ncbi:hypothetical protein F4802DRAFT_599739 [Xylaria palmicola]|nr:hypothetical protein F4802DRAFT_599739 [Xylaria palmicola]